MKAKGTAITFFPSFVESKFGTDKMTAWVNELPSASKEIFSRPILASSWYPIEDGLTAPLRSICNNFYGGDIKGAWEVGRYSADFGLKGIYKLFVKLGSPESLAKRAAEVLPKYYDQCSMEVMTAQKGGAVLRVTEFPGSDPFIEARLAGYMERAVEICGGKNVRVVISSALSKGAPYTEFKVSWQA